MLNILSRDVFLNLVVILTLLLMMVIYFINDPSKESKMEPPGNVLVSIVWPEGNTDIDLWVFGPGEVKPVGYSNKGGAVWNLLRDDLGNSPDATPMNYENSIARGIIPGEYIVNVHCFRCPILPVPVDVEISTNNISQTGKAGMKIIATTRVILDSNGEEKTALRFKLDTKGRLVPNSANSIFRPLRAANTYTATPGGRGGVQ